MFGFDGIIEMLLLSYLLLNCIFRAISETCDLQKHDFSYTYVHICVCISTDIVYFWS